jgi:hypothetical protein
MSRTQRAPWSESEKVRCSRLESFFIHLQPNARRLWAVQTDSTCPLQIALLVEISRDVGQDPVLLLARAILLNSPEPRWDEISLPPGTPMSHVHYSTTIPRVEACQSPGHELRAFADAVERAQSKVLQGRIRRDPQHLSRSSNPTASSRLPDKPSTYSLSAANGWEEDFSGN